ncbi:hypothetical protein CRG98_038301 [Punica granatum]|uniref:Uncharacterized protein n=1 Tax=Punica granatum TaxID=22663 RepID=A0A2I0IBE0_PUNGR|nr:hypothetical protein CRG98_038301 [Punica granatum]
MAGGDSFSPAPVARPREGGHSQAALHRRAHACPDEIKIRVARWNPGGPMITGCPGIVGVPLLSHLGSTLIFLGQGSTSPQQSQIAPIPRATPTSAPEAESSTQAAMRAELQSIMEERDRLRCELVDSRAEVADYRELQTELARARARIATLDREMARLSATLDRVKVITTGVASIPYWSTHQDGRRGPSLCTPEFHLVGARMREASATRLGSVHLPGDARRTRVRRSRHLPFYDPKVEGRQVTREPGVGSDRSNGLRENQSVLTVSNGPIEFPDLECLNDEDLNEPNIAICRVNERSGDSAPRESVLPVWTFGVEFSVPRCSGIVVIPVFRGRAPKARRETFMTTETSLGKPSRVSEGHLKLVPRPWWSLGACRPDLGGRLLVSGAGPGSSCHSASSVVFGIPCSFILLMVLLRLSRWTMLFSYCSWFRDRMFASDCRAMNSVPSFGRESSVGAGGPKWGADSLPIFGCVLD